MAITAAQKVAIEEIINLLCTTTATRGKRQVAGMFLDLVDRTDWPQYYEVIPEPRCLNNIRSSLEKNRYKDSMDAYTDLSLVFWNAMFYNETDSQISLDAAMLKGILENEWKKRTFLPTPRESPPPSAPQKVHGVVEPSPPKPTPTPQPPPTAPTPTPIAPPPAPVINSNSYSYPGKPVQSRPRSSPLPGSPDMDVDIGGMSELDGQGEDLTGMERDANSEEIVKQLEKGLPRWEGFGDVGWVEEIDHDRQAEIIHVIKSHKDVIGNRIAIALEAVPEEPSIPDLGYTLPLSLKIVEGRTRSKSYPSSKEFDLEMARLFEKARRWHEPCTEPYGRILLLQRFYQALTSPTPPLGPPFTSTTNFASLRAGPGNIKPLHSATEGEGVSGVTSYRVSTKDRSFVEEVHYKGWTIRLADWLHLSNPDDPSRPIVAQVFKCWVSDNVIQPGVTVCWYLRPEQTFHSARRQFWEGEVFKTGHFADHPLEDIIEKIACQFTARHIRGRPRPPYWYPGWPLYVCNSRYNDREHVFVRIKNWNSCVPEEVRKSAKFMPIYPFERTVFPRRVVSPFVSKTGKVKGPGGIEEGAETAVEQTDKAEGDGNGRKRLRRTGTGVNAGGDYAGLPNKGGYAGAPVGGANALLSTFHHPYQPSHLSQQIQPHNRSQAGSDRSIISAAGGLVNLENHASIEKLPAETAKYFDRDPETNEVLWFSAPPMNLARPSGPKHSLTYLHFLAMKRKEGNGGGDDSMDVDSESPITAKRKRERVPPTVTEAIGSILADLTPRD